MDKKIFIFAGITLLIDQLTKLLIGSLIKAGDVITVIEGFFSFENVVNTGAAFSILTGSRVLLCVLSVLAIGIILYMARDFKNNMRSEISFGLVLGGILGNFIDRLFLGHVRDFLSFNIFGYDFPVFNVADMGIVIGVILMIYCMFKGDDRDGNQSRKLRRRD